MEVKYQANFPPCPICGRPMSTKSKTCAFCASKGRGSLRVRSFVDKICKYCGATFAIPLWREKQGRGTFCSRECKDAYLTTLIGGRSIRWRGGTAGHRRGIGWQIAKKWALVRANNKCERCGSDDIRQLRVHHKKAYKKCKDDIEANSPNNLVVLCVSCHAKVEALGRLAEKEVMPR